MDPWHIIGWAVIAWVIFVVCVIVYKLARIVIDQRLSDRKRRRAHSGKISCEDKSESCEHIATRVTPIGYFCEEHYGQNSKKPIQSGSVSYAHLLNHVSKRAIK